MDTSQHHNATSNTDDRKGSISTGQIKGLHFYEGSRKAAQHEHELTVRQAVSQHKGGLFWAAFFCLPNLIIGYDPTIVGTLVGIPEFRKRFGYEYPTGSGMYVLEAAWTSAYTYAPVIGFMLASIWGGWCVDRFGSRKTLLGATLLSLGTLLIEVLGESAAVIFIGDLLTGLLTGSFPVLGPAYISEILPVSLRGIGLSCNNLCQVLGSLIGVGILRGTENRTDKWAYKVPFITEYAFPLLFILGCFFAPETPWFLVKRGRYEEATKSLQRIGYIEEVDDTLAHMKETVLLEEEMCNSSTFWDCFRGTNLRRTLICAIAYSGQFFCGINLASGYCTYFFELSGVTTDQAFDLSCGLFALGVVGNILSWPLITYWGRRNGYLLTALLSTCFMYLIGFLGIAPASNTGAMYAKSVILLLFNFVYNIGLGPIVYVLIAELPSTKIRGRTLGVACLAAHVFSISITAGLPYAMSPTEANWGAKTGFLFAGTGTLTVIWAFFYLPETKNRTFEELDIMFGRNLPAREFGKLDLGDLEHPEIVGKTDGTV